MHLKTGLLSFFFLLLSLPVFALDFWDEADPVTLSADLAAAMDDQELLGQVLLLGYYGYEPSPEIERSISVRKTGGIKIFGWNVGDIPSLAASVKSMQERAQENRFRIPLFIVTDQEGGWVRHIRKGTSETTGNLGLGATNIPRDSYLTGYYIGLEMRALGINVNFAPTVDIYTNPKANVIGPRAFSDDPVQTGVLATAFFKGMDSAGVIATAKHFPGHGNADADSHSVLPVIHSGMETVWDTDLVPYRFLIREGIPAIMTGHLAFPEITGDFMPATLSSFMLTDLLRDRMGFKGLIITDDLIMYGVQSLSYDTATITIMAIMAGNDLVLISRTPELHEKIFNRLLAEMKTDPEFKARVIQSAERVLRTKMAYLKKPGAVPLFPELPALAEDVISPEGRDFFIDQSFRSVAPVQWPGDYTPPDPSGKILLAGQYDEFFDEGSDFYPDADRFPISYSPFYYPVEKEKNRFRQTADRYDTIIFCLANPNSLEILKTLENFNGNLIVLSVLTPIYLTEVPWADHSLALFGTTPDSFRAGFSVIRGVYTPTGTVPLGSL